MKSIVRWIWLLLIVLSLSSSQAAQAQSGEQLWLLNQINNLRAQLGIHSFVWNPQLAAAAQQQSEYMAATGHISHQQSNGSMPSDRARANGYTGSWISENIYGGGMATANHAWNFWLNSSIHYAGMTNQNTNEIGIGVASGSSGQYYTLVFGYRSDVNAPPAQVVDNSSTSDGESPPVQAPPQAPPPTRAPPTSTFTPSPTVPTFTPTPTWTLTPTWTPSASPTLAPPTSTPISLPTAAMVAAEPTQIANEASPAATQVESESPRHQQVAVVDDEGFNLSDLLPIFLAGQVILISVGIYSLFFRSTKKT